MSYTLFISDLHLQTEQPAITARFLQLLQTDAAQADALYILGDLFEAWIGDDDHSDFHTLIKDALKALANKGVPLYFMRGNRDFLIDTPFTNAIGARLLRDPSRITLYGTPILLTHGDSLCTQDRRHQLFRAIVQSPFNKLFLCLPLSLRRRIAHFLRAQSIKHTRKKSNNLLDVNRDEVERVMAAANTLLMIHGHTHRPAIHDLTVDGKAAKRIVLGAWHGAADILEYHDTHRYCLKI